MLSDEEKKAIERLIIYKDKIKDELYPIIDFEEEKAIGIILNLIEKQSKEIEEYNTKLLSNAGIYQLGFNDGKKTVENKIKAKIEEYEKNRDKAKITSIEYDIYVCIIEVLQSFLENIKGGQQ